MIAYLSTLFALLKSGPQILEAIMEIKLMWDQYLEQDKKHEAMVKFTDAINVARTRKDTGPLLELVNNIISGSPVK